MDNAKFWTRTLIYLNKSQTIHFYIKKILTYKKRVSLKENPFFYKNTHIF